MNMLIQYNPPLKGKIRENHFNKHAQQYSFG